MTERPGHGVRTHRPPRLVRRDPTDARPTPRPLRVLLANPHPVFRAGLRALVAGTGDLALTGEPRDLGEAIRLAAELEPDVVVVDLPAERADALDAVGRMRRPVLVLSARADDDALVAALRAGARGCVSMAAGEHELVGAIRAVAAGGAQFGAEVADRVLELARDARPARRAFADLTEREHEVLELLADGAPNGLIAQRLFLSPKTVRNHVSSICTKLAVADRVQAALRAREAGVGVG